MILGCYCPSFDCNVSNDDWVGLSICLFCCHLCVKLSTGVFFEFIFFILGMLLKSDASWLFLGHCPPFDGFVSNDAWIRQAIWWFECQLVAVNGSWAVFEFISVFLFILILCYHNSCYLGFYWVNSAHLLTVMYQMMLEQVKKHGSCCVTRVWDVCVVVIFHFT